MKIISLRIMGGNNMENELLVNLYTLRSDISAISVEN